MSLAVTSCRFVIGYFGKYENSSLLKIFASTSWKSILKLGNLLIFNRISQKKRLQRPPKVRSNCMRKINLSLAHLTAQIDCYELKGDLNPVMLKEFWKFRKLLYSWLNIIVSYLENIIIYTPPFKLFYTVLPARIKLLFLKSNARKETKIGLASNQLTSNW